MGFGEITPTSMLSNAALRELLANAVTKALQITQAHVATLVLSREEPFSVLALGATHDAPDVPTADLISGTLGRGVFDTALPVLTLDAQEHELGGSVSNSIFELSVSTVMCVPLFSDGSRANSAIYCATFGIGGQYDAKSLAALMAHARVLTPLLEHLGQLKGCK